MIVRIRNLCCISVLLLLLSWTAHGAEDFRGPNCEKHRHDDRISLACNIYFEANTESYEGMLAVAAVTMNRVASDEYPNTVREVVWQRARDWRTGKMVAHFSWTLDGKVDIAKSRKLWNIAMRIASRFSMTREARVAMCPEVRSTNISRVATGRKAAPVFCRAYDTMNRHYIHVAQLSDPTDGALLYHANYVNPYWVDDRYLTVEIDRHLFYTRARIVKRRSTRVSYRTVKEHSFVTE